MAYTNSKLVNHTRLSPNCNKPRNHAIDTITIHHMAGDLSVETCGSVFASSSRGASANYGIDSDGRVGLYVEEANRSWATSSSSNDNRAVTIEVANDKPSDAGKWHVSDKALAKLIDLCVDICKRNGIKKLNYTGNKSGNLTMHKWFAATACPGPYLESKFPYIAEQVNKRLGAKTTATSTTKTPSNTVKVKSKTSYLRSQAYVDDIYKTSKKLKTCKVGTSLTWVKDDGYGWSYCKTSDGKTAGWIQNTRINKNGLSKYPLATVTGNAVRVRKMPNGTILKQVNKGTTFTAYYQIPSGTNKGWTAIAVSGQSGDCFISSDYVKLTKRK